MLGGNACLGGWALKLLHILALPPVCPSPFFFHITHTMLMPSLSPPQAVLPELAHEEVFVDAAPEDCNLGRRLGCFVVAAVEELRSALGLPGALPLLCTLRCG